LQLFPRVPAADQTEPAKPATASARDDGSGTGANDTPRIEVPIGAEYKVVNVSPLASAAFV